MRIIFEQGNYRIVELADTGYDIADLKGNMYNPAAHFDLDQSQLKQEERDFEDLVSRKGVYGYELESWNPAVGAGWEYVDSCWGFVGQYSETDEAFKHYIVDEMKQQIP